MLTLPITNYTVWQIKKGVKIIALVLLLIIALGNIYNIIFTKRIRLNPESYTTKNGFVFFTSQKEYIDIVRSYRYDFGTGIIIHRMRSGESYWDVARMNRISIDTLISANPFFESLQAEEGIEIAVPLENGVLLAADSMLDVFRMSRIVTYTGSVQGDYIHSILRILSPDDIRFAFFREAKPEIVNNSLERLYAMRKMFQSPIRGNYTSMYGQRVDPFIHGVAFHNGIDINGRTGDPIYPAREGMVSFIGWYGNMGQCVKIQHPEGYETFYGHCSSIRVKVGDYVKKDEIIAAIGSTGRSTGSHLHFMLRRHGHLIDPLLIIW